MNIPPPPPPLLAFGPFGGPQAQFINAQDPESGVQIGDEILRDGNCFQLPNDRNIYKATFHWGKIFGQNIYRFEGITRQIYNQGDWGDNERIHQNGFVQRMAGLEIVPCPALNRNTAREAYSALRTMNQVSRQGLMPHLSATVPASRNQPAREVQVPANLQGSIESYLTGFPGAPRQTRAQMRELLTRPRPEYPYGQLQPGVGGKKQQRRRKTRRSKSKRRKTQRRKH
jgi:hypothetical protein